MGIDEKYIGGTFYTIISNLETKKVAAILETVKASEIKSCLYNLPQKVRWDVEVLTRDLAGVFENVGHEIFLKSRSVADKFHVLKLGFEALQSVRIRYRQEALTEERHRIESHRVKEAERRDHAQREGGSFLPTSLPVMPLLKNKETKLQLLARSRYLLFKFEKAWSESQKERAKILFDLYPDLKKSYEIIKKFRIFYEITPQNNRKKAQKSLQEWGQLVGAVDISEIQNFASTVTRHQLVILNYFESGETNALAESLNNKIQRFLIHSHGTRDPDFLFFRLQNFLT